MREDGKLASRAKRIMRSTPREELAAAVGVKDPDTISHWMNGTGSGGLTLEKLQKLCNKLGVTPNELLLEEEELAASRPAEAREAALVVLRRMMEEEGARQGDGGARQSDGARPVRAPDQP